MLRGSLVFCVAVLAIVVNSIPVSSAAPADSTQLKPVVVSGTRFATGIGTTPASISIIDRTEIEATGAASVSELLRGRGGVQINDLVGDGSRTTVSMRGFGANAASNVLILVDGRRLNNTDLDAPDLGSVSIEDIERIEIVQGSAGTLFGDQAVGGVINIITRQMTALQGDVELGTGSYGRWQRQFALADALDNGVFYRLRGEQVDTDNYRDNNRQDRENLLGKFGWRHAGGSVFAEYQRIDENLELAGTLFPAQLAADREQAANPGDRSGTDTEVWRIGLDQALGRYWQLQAELTDRRADTGSTISFGGAPTAFTADREHKSFNPRMLGLFPMAHGDAVLTLGADLENTDFATANLFGNTRNEQDMWSFYTQAQLPVRPDWTLTLGARHAEVKNDLVDRGLFGAFPAGVELNDDQTVGEVGLSYQVSELWRLFVRVDDNFRFALANEQTFTPPGVVGLDTQTGRSYETGAEWLSGGNQAKVVLYRLDLKDEIDFNPLAGFFGANENLDDTRRHGVIVEGRRQISRYLALSGQYSFTAAEFRGGPVKGSEIPFVAEHSGRLSLEVANLGPFGGFVELLATSDRVASGDFASSVADLPGYGIVNAGMHGDWGPWRASVRLNNLEDRRYSELAIAAFDPATFLPATAFFPAPRRNLRFNMTYRFR